MVSGSDWGPLSDSGWDGGHRQLQTETEGDWRLQAETEGAWRLQTGTEEAQLTEVVRDGAQVEISGERERDGDLKQLKAFKFF